MTKRERSWILGAAVMLTALATLMASVAHAQPTGTIRGCVSLPYEKGPLPRGVFIRGVGSGGGGKVEPDGTFVLEGLIPGDYFMEVKTFGYQWVKQRVRVLPSRETHVEIRFDEKESRWPREDLTEVPRVAIESVIMMGSERVRRRTGEELQRGTRSSLFGAPSP